MTIFKPRKRFGQNFLIDDSIIEKIMIAINPKSNDSIIEIGPGLSALTAPLLDKLDSLIAIEIDKDIARILRDRYSSKKLILLENDVMKQDFSIFGRNIRIVGNLPYNISSPLLFHLMSVADIVIDQHFMLQKEVVDRMVAIPSSKSYGRLSVMLQERYKIEKLFDVSPESFYPKPKVFSSIVRLIPLSDERNKPNNYLLFKKIVLEAFSKRRKTLRNSLKNISKNIHWDKLMISPESRAEDISVEQFINLSDHFFNDQIGCRL
ncbi:16S rRNA (adenine(1518)-N(6)/adenine(1519)-N(6))-dimethyltransferase RsmA [Candidatus Kinetoplastidibacterium galati]|uniref:Ribosomal RNA small subunit methyltransferase A n=1 Tax=Candidatus Kinetoplastidibacterium galati TCC219 TaxID=1208921 RepID=M1MAA5_9PROT|nr:16S rRNA (adenine(1518)-N(6)/adenine(1519)-N(6))-dimethyltransferase RsmA [Candidatus Kinetoplastibacterium galatii]AGF48830.1 dimethyladenosine transferase [Candidatus Kinetoplastibacterium galatii TCC219]